AALKLCASICSPLSALLIRVSHAMTCGSYKRFQYTAVAPLAPINSFSAASVGPRRMTKREPAARRSSASASSEQCSHTRGARRRQGRVVGQPQVASKPDDDTLMHTVHPTRRTLAQAVLSSCCPGTTLAVTRHRLTARTTQKSRRPLAERLMQGKLRCCK